MKTLLLYIFWVFVILCLSIPPIILSVVFEFSILHGIFPIGISVYSLIITIHFIIQMLLSWLNYRNVEKISKQCDISTLKEKVGIVVVGWKEDPLSFDNCIESIKRLDYPNVEMVVCVSDGNDVDDQFMANTFKRHFQDTCVFQAPNDIKDNFILHTSNKNVCVMMPHRGKRHAMYMGINTVLENIPECDLVFLTDSDTWHHTNGLTELVKVYKSDINCHGVSGNISLNNINNFLTLMLNYKYWFAFNIVRSAQSYVGVVNCIGGPSALYSASMLKTIKEEWFNQNFIGKRCTYGDDRHLTNKVLEQGKRVLYTHRAICYTDTPQTFISWVCQQVRWAKSFFREFIINIKWFHLHNPWLAIDLIFSMVYPICLVIFVIYILSQLKFSSVLYLCSSVVVMSFVRAIFGFLLTYDLKNFYIIPFGFCYIFFILPSKAISYCFITNTEWGTGNRQKKTSSNVNKIIICVWCIIITVGIIVSLICDYNELHNIWHIVILSSVFGINICVYLIYKLFANSIHVNINNDINTKLGFRAIGKIIECNEIIIE